MSALHECECGVAYIVGDEDSEARHAAAHTPWAKWPIASVLRDLPVEAVIDGYVVVRVDLAMPEEFAAQRRRRREASAGTWGEAYASTAATSHRTRTRG